MNCAYYQEEPGYVSSVLLELVTCMGSDLSPAWKERNWREFWCTCWANCHPTELDVLSDSDGLNVCAVRCQELLFKWRTGFK